MNERRDRVHNLTRRTSRRDISHIAHRRRGILLNFGISSLSDRSRPPRVLPIPRRILPFTTPDEPRYAGLNFASSREEASRGRIDVDRLNSAGREMSYLFICRVTHENIFRRRCRSCLFDNNLYSISNFSLNLCNSTLKIN